MKNLFVILLVLLFGGCSMVGPGFTKPKQPPLPKEWSDTNASKKDISSWWKQFHDKQLNTLIEIALKQNLNLRSAGMRILQARAALGFAQGLNYPQSQTLSGSLATGSKSSHSLLSMSTSFDLAWEMDLWGKYARGIESAEATLLASFASYEDIMVLITSEVARNYINYATANERIEYAKKNIEIQKKVLHMTQVQYNAGNVSELDVQQAKTQLYATKSLLPVLQKSKILSRNALAILLGKTPNEMQNILKDSKIKKIPLFAMNDKPVFNAQLLSSRPDIKLAEYQAHAQSAKIGLKEADLYPHFYLFGTVGYSALKIGSLPTSDSVTVVAGPGFSWNILQYGRLKNLVRIEDAAYQASLINYSKKLLQALSEVNSALLGYKLTKEQLDLNQKTIEATKRAFEISLVQYEQGLVSYQRLLSTVESLTKSQDLYAQTKGGVALELIALYKALGGGYKSVQNQEYIHKQDLQELQQRGVDWGEYLELEDE